MALAFNGKYFTAPHAGRQLRSDCDFLPVIWAHEGDAVLVDDIESAKAHLRRLGIDSSKYELVTKQLPRRLNRIKSIEPWGWDEAIAFKLGRLGISADLLPSHAQIASWRELSSRRFAALALHDVCERLQSRHCAVVGSATYVTQAEDIKEMLHSQPKSVIKAPWSSSGRGIRYVQDQLDPSIERWAENVISQQGGIMIEPYYNKVKDFGMEFTVRDGQITYNGLSIFSTVHGAYTGNVIANEAYKQEALSAYLSPDVLKEVRNVIKEVLEPSLSNYNGCFGVDMMIVRDNNENLLLHPMVEINLRRTMGHVALALSERKPSTHAIMRIVYEGTRYHLRLLRM